MSAAGIFGRPSGISPERKTLMSSEAAACPGSAARPRLRRNDVPGLVFALLDRAQIPYLLKTQVLATIRSAQPLTVLQSLDLDDHLRTAIGEILLAQEI